MYKIRTMHRNAEEILKRDQKLYQEYLVNNFKLPENKDPRLTLIGKFLRKTSLDELPQFFNVIKGEMSIVGPRPIVPKELEHYGNFKKAFLSAKPGLTGLWQVSGRSKVGYPERAQLELEYIENQSFSYDIKILLKTFPSVLKSKGAF